MMRTATSVLVVGLMAGGVWGAALPAAKTSLHPRASQQEDQGGVQIFPQINMTDTNGNAIQAHGGTIVQATDQFYWFGEDKAGETTSGHFQAVNCYASADLGTWEFRGAVLQPVPGTNISSDHIVERPKVLHNAKNDEYVMWFHGDTSNYGAAQVGVATSPTIDGAYTWKGNFKPLGTDSRDMTVWQDPEDGTGYLIFASDNNRNLKVARLDDDYYDVAEQLYIWEDVYWEAPGVLKINGVFYLLYSRQDGWTPTDNYYMTSTSMAGPWSAPRLLAPAGLYAYNTQNAYEITLQGPGGTTYMYLGDHWNAPNLGASTYAWYPLEFVDGASGAGELSISYTGGYRLDAHAGTWAPLQATTIDTAQLSSASNNTNTTTVVNCATCASGKAVDLSNGDPVSFTWSGLPGDKVLSFRYTYAAGKQAWQQLAVAVDGQVPPLSPQGNAALLESTRNASNYFDAPVRVGGVKTGSRIEFAVPNNGSSSGGGGAAVLVTSVDVYDVDVPQ